MNYCILTNVNETRSYVFFSLLLSICAYVCGCVDERSVNVCVAEYVLYAGLVWYGLLFPLLL